MYNTKYCIAVLQALAVWTGDRVRHYMIFYEEVGVAAELVVLSSVFRVLVGSDASILAFLFAFFFLSTSASTPAKSLISLHIGNSAT